MGLVSKIKRGVSKLGSFVGKVVKGASEGGLIGAGASFVQNLGGSSTKKQSAAQKATFASTNLYNNALPAMDVNTDTQKRNKVIMIVVGVLGFLTTLFLIFKRKR
jgi:hypothetical protein